MMMYNYMLFVSNNVDLAPVSTPTQATKTCSSNPIRANILTAVTL